MCPTTPSSTVSRPSESRAAESLCDLLRRCGRETAFPSRAALRCSAWEDLVARVGSFLDHTVRRSLLTHGLSPRSGEVEELVQEVYFRLLGHGGRRLRAFAGEHPAQARAFLRQVSRRVVLDTLRHSQRRKRAGVEGLFGAVRLPPAELGYLRYGNPESSLLARERVDHLFERCRRAAGRRNPDRNLRILKLALLEGRSSREISRHLGGRLAPSSIDSVIHRVRRELSRGGDEIRRRPPAARVALSG